MDLYFGELVMGRGFIFRGNFASVESITYYEESINLGQALAFYFKKKL